MEILMFFLKVLGVLAIAVIGLIVVASIGVVAGGFILVAFFVWLLVIGSEWK